MKKITIVFLLLTILFSLSPSIIRASESKIGSEVAHYTFEGKTASLDCSSNKNDASSYNILLDDTHKINESSNKYGIFATNKYMIMPNVFSGDFSVSLWAMANSLNDYQRLFDFGKDNYYIALFQYADGNIGVSYNNGLGNVNSYASPGTIVTNTWVHYAITVSGKEIKVYVNNELKLTVTMSITISEMLISQSDFTDNYIGKSRYQGDPYFDGYIDDFRVYNGVLENSTIELLSNGNFVCIDEEAYKYPSINSGLTNHYTFDTSIGVDYSGAMNNAKITSGIKLDSINGVNNKSGSYALFDGKTGGLKLQNNLLDKNTNEFTFTAWVRFDKLDNFIRVFDFGVSNRVYLTLWAYEDGGAKLVISASGSGNQIEIGTFLNIFHTNEWTHVSLTMKKNTATFYINGEPILSKNIPMSISDLYNDSIYKDHTQNFIGVSHFVSDGKFTGAMDEIRIYNRALPDSQIKYIKNNCFGSNNQIINETVINMSVNKDDNIAYEGEKELVDNRTNYFTISSWNSYIQRISFDQSTQTILTDEYGFNQNASLIVTQTGLYVLLIKKGDSIIGRYLISVQEKETHKLSFNLDNGQVISDKYVTDGNSVILPVPIKNGYIFNGWYSDSTLTNKVDSSTAIISDMILYPSWLAK